MIKTSACAKEIKTIKLTSKLVTSSLTTLRSFYTRASAVLNLFKLFIKNEKEKQTIQNHLLLHKLQHLALYFARFQIR